jgi:zinc transport system substrate-binding protein
MIVRRRAFDLSALAGLLVFAACPAHAEVKVVVTSKPAHALVAAVMTGAGTPGLLVQGAASPHSFAMKPSDARRVNEADVFFRISEGLEPFTAKLAKALPSSVRLVTLAQAPGMALLERREGGDFEAHQHEDKKSGKGHGHKHGAKAKSVAQDDDAEDEVDPHVWLDPANAKAMTQEIARVLTERDPGEAARYKSNADALIARLDALAGELDGALKPIADRPFIVFHDAYQYFEKRFGLKAVGSITTSPDVQPSGKRLSALRSKVRKLGAVCVFAEPNFEPKVAGSVIEGTAAKAGTLDPEGTALTEGPELYFTLMRGLATSLKACLAGS